MCLDNATEHWLPIHGHERRYEISCWGHVRSLRRKQILKPTLNSKGVQVVVLSYRQVQTFHAVHLLVADAFLPNPQQLPRVRHKDKVKTNNKSQNLEWKPHHLTNLTTSKVGRIKKLLRRGVSPQDIAVGSGITYKTILAIKNGEIWRETPADP